MKNRPCIMVVDDQQEMLDMLTRIFKLEGYDVAVASDGRAALALLDKRSPALVVLDIIMPELDGFQVLNLIRQRSNIPIIMLTARSEVTSVHRALALGADDYVRKPFSAREVVARVKAKLRHVTSTVPYQGG